MDYSRVLTASPAGRPPIVVGNNRYSAPIEGRSVDMGNYELDMRADAKRLGVLHASTARRRRTLLRQGRKTAAFFPSNLEHP